MKQAYVCGPYTHPTEEGILSRIRSALGHAHSLTQAGWFVIVPHVSGPHAVTWDEAMVRCRETIQGLNPETDVLVTLPGWPQSRGSREEVELAGSLGVPVLTVGQAMRRAG